MSDICSSLPEINVNNIMQFANDARCVDVMHERWTTLLTQKHIEPISPEYNMQTITRHLAYYADLSSYFDSLWGRVRLSAGTAKHLIALRDVLEKMGQDARFKYEATSRIITSYEILMKEAQQEKRY